MLILQRVSAIHAVAAVVVTLTVANVYHILRRSESVVGWRLNDYSLYQNYWYWVIFIEVISITEVVFFDSHCMCVGRQMAGAVAVYL